MKRRVSRRSKNNYHNNPKPKIKFKEDQISDHEYPIKTYKKGVRKIHNKFAYFYHEIATSRILTPLYKMAYNYVDGLALVKDNLLSKELSQEIQDNPDKYELMGNTDNGDIEMVETSALTSFIELVFNEIGPQVPDELFFILENGNIIISDEKSYNFSFLPYDCHSQEIEGIDWIYPAKKIINEIMSKLESINFSIVTNIFTNIPELAHFSENYPQISLLFDDTLNYLETSFYAIVDSNDEDNVHIYSNDQSMIELLAKDFR